MSKRFLQPFSFSSLRSRRVKSRPIRNDCRPLMETLEDRIVPATAYLSGSESIAHPLIPVALQQPAAQTITVSYAVVAGGTAVSGKDFTLPAGKLTFNKGDTVKDVPLTILDNGLPETNETIFIQLSAPKGTSLGPTSEVVYTILKSEPLPSVAFTTTTGSGLESKAGSFQVLAVGQVHRARDGPVHGDRRHGDRRRGGLHAEAGHAHVQAWADHADRFHSRRQRQAQRGQRNHPTGARQPHQRRRWAATPRSPTPSLTTTPSPASPSRRPPAAVWKISPAPRWRCRCRRSRVRLSRSPTR